MKVRQELTQQVNQREFGKVREIITQLSNERRF